MPQAERAEKAPPFDLIVVGGGAAGFFAAIQCGQKQPGARILILEKSRETLQKVRISGGGRCNVTHECHDPRDLAENYPRGGRSLIGPFCRFGPLDTIDWFESHGVELKTESDGRLFPVTDRSTTVIDCLRSEADRYGITVRTGSEVQAVHRVPGQVGAQQAPLFEVFLEAGGAVRTRQLLLATGGIRSRSGAALAQDLGHTLIPAAPSLFTFRIDDPRLADLAGLSVPAARITVLDEAARTGKRALSSSGPVLITHWGLSGPAVLKLSALGARVLQKRDYRFVIEIDWGLDSPEETLRSRSGQFGARKASKDKLAPLPSRLWSRLVDAAGIPENRSWAQLGKSEFVSLLEQLTHTRLQVHGKSTHKDEFVTAGGVPLEEVDLKTFESKLVPGLYLAGELLDIDGLTGGFNFQAAWTGGWHAGQAAAEACRPAHGPSEKPVI